MKSMPNLMAGLVAVLLLTAPLVSSAQDKPRQVLFTNVNIFNGKDAKVITGGSVLVEGNLIKTVSANKIDAPGAFTVDGGGRTLMPGLIDAHTHLYVNMDGGVPALEAGTWDEIGARAVHMANEYLYSGFTTVREMGGGGSGLKKAVDAGLIDGPRIYPAGAYISQTSGHGDMRSSSQRNPNLPPYAADSSTQRLGITIIADGEDAVIAAVRQNLSQGASQLKVMAGGGVSSYFDPLDTTQYTLEELKAIVTEAEHWGTYVAAHAYTDEAVRLYIEAGIKSIEHGPFLTEDTLQLMAKEGSGFRHRHTCSA